MRYAKWVACGFGAIALFFGLALVLAFAIVSSSMPPPVLPAAKPVPIAVPPPRVKSAYRLTLENALNAWIAGATDRADIERELGLGMFLDPDFSSGRKLVRYTITSDRPSDATDGGCDCRAVVTFSSGEGSMKDFTCYQRNGKFIVSGLWAEGWPFHFPMKSD